MPLEFMDMLAKPTLGFKPGTTLKCEPGVSPESLRLHAEWYR